VTAVQESRRRFLQKALAGTAIAGATLAFGQQLTPVAHAAASGADDFGYLIYLNGTTVNAVNGSTGQIDFTGTDAATVIQSAINSAPTGSFIMIKPGTYVINSTITISKAVRIVGSGVTSAGTILQNNQNGVMILVTQGGAYVRIEGLTCRGTGNSSDVGIQVSGVNNAVIRGVLFVGHYNDLVFSGTCFYCTVENCEWYSATNELISTDSTTNLNLHITNCYGFVNSAANGFNLQGLNSVILDSVEISGSFTGTVLILDRYVGGVFFAIGSMFENSVNNNRAVWIKGTDPNPGHTVNFLFFNNCYFGGGKYAPPTILPAIQIDYANEIQFDGGDIAGNYRGILINGAVKDMHVRSINWNVNSSGIASSLGAVIGDLIVQGNRWRLGSDYLVNFSNLLASQMTGQNLFAQNDVTTTLGFYLPTGAPVIVKDNPGFNPQPISTIAMGSSPFTYTNNDGYPEIVMVTANGGLYVLTYRGENASAAAGIPFLLNPGESMVFTWSGTAPTARKLPL
jgi:hypothetical protein